MLDDMYQVGFDDGEYNYSEFVRRHIEQRIHSRMVSGKGLSEIKILRELASRAELDVEVLDYEGYYEGYREYMNSGDGSDDYLDGYEEGESVAREEYRQAFDKLKNEYLDQDKYRAVKTLNEFDQDLTVWENFRVMTDEEYEEHERLDSIKWGF